MPHHLPVLSRTSVIAISFAAMVLLGGLLRQTGAALGGMLDLTLTGAEARALLDRLTPWQRDVHAHATLLYDGLYPLAYGAFFAGLAVRLGGAKARWIALVMLGGMVADYAENIVQLLALSGRADWLDAKTLLTPIKFALTGTAVLATLVLSVRAGVALLRR
ncbi:hypothetical protein [Sphingomonas ursincola]|uniref:hypothetical protein n=1 Tax=Sphingomonas ursincola TaxID=56361 RepID=UPI0023570C7F|nr:hypothetical protein [Sphingomonas ursincola]MBY0619280.1 hypothetical protein [Sphingomonas ursincola]